MSIFLFPHPFPPSHCTSAVPILFTCKNSVPVLEMEELKQQAALSQEREGRENYLWLRPRGADHCCCVLAQRGAPGCGGSSTGAWQH